MLVLLANWFPPEERARANAFFMCSNSLAYIITGPVSAWLINNWGWRYVFIVEGLVTMGLAFIFYPLVQDRPEQAKWLSAAERDYLVGRAKQEEESLKLMKNAPVSYKAILSSWNLWKLGIILPPWPGFIYLREPRTAAAIEGCGWRWRDWGFRSSSSSPHRPRE